jgi:hypothetical protein
LFDVLEFKDAINRRGLRDLLCRGARYKTKHPENKPSISSS